MTSLRYISMVLIFNILFDYQKYRFLKGFKASLLSSLLTRNNRLKKPTIVFNDVSNGIKYDGNFFITTPIYYVNGLPHLGHAYTSVLCDIIARFHRKDNMNVFFLTGTDEHGQKVEQSAIKNEKTPIQFADEVSAQFRSLVHKLGCSNNDFIRTTEERHKLAVCELWKKLEQNNQIYLGSYEGWYSIRDEAYYAESELVNGKAPTGAEVEWVKEESYFFKLSEWTDKLLQFYEEHPEFIAPRGRRNEVVSFVSQEGGLKDLSISRTNFAWGIPVPGNDKHVIYVWLDALTNYLSVLEYPNMESKGFKQFWPASLHVVGKDILRFHAVFWPAFLMAAGLEPPQRVFAHGWWTRDGEKMSKSVGNVLDPLELIDLYGVDYLRYYMAAEINFGNDGDFSHDLFCTKINTELANDLGNLAQRTLTMIGKHCDSRIPAPGDFKHDDIEILEALKQSVPLTRSYVRMQSMKSYCDTVIQLARLGNKYIDTQAPWVLIKTDKERMYTVLYVLTELLRYSAILLEPVMPSSCNKMLDLLGIPSTIEARSIRALEQNLTAGLQIGSPIPLFPKLEITAAINNSANNETIVSQKAIIGKDYEHYDALTISELSDKILEVGSNLRNKKAAKVDKEELKPLLNELNYLKNRYKVINDGVAYESK